MKELVEVIQKIKEYIGNRGDMLNKAQLSYNHMATNPVFGTNVITVLVDLAQ